ncbi:MAG: hypothetical protein GY915_06350 [bacterium]|nr:hypothetical protein [bacterium]
MSPSISTITAASPPPEEPGPSRKRKISSIFLSKSERRLIPKEGLGVFKTYYPSSLSYSDFIRPPNFVGSTDYAGYRNRLDMYSNMPLFELFIRECIELLEIKEITGGIDISMQYLHRNFRHLITNFHMNYVCNKAAPEELYFVSNLLKNSENSLFVRPPGEVDHCEDIRRMIREALVERFCL